MGAKQANEAIDAQGQSNEASESKKMWWFKQPNPIDRFTGWLVLWTALLFAANVVTDVFVWQQWRVANDAQLDNRAQLRAVVTQVGGTINVATDKAGNTIGYNISPNFRNWGGTRTEKAAGWASVHYFDGDVPNNINLSKPWDKVDPLSAIIPANTTASLGPTGLPVADAEKAFNKKGIIILWGHLDWSDIFSPDEIHPIQFCLKMNPVGKNDNGEILFGTPAPYKAECNSSK